MQNVRNRAKITDPRIQELIQECVKGTQEMGFKLPNTLKFLQCKAKRRAGLACYRGPTIVLSTFLYKEEDNAIKTVIYHELGHIIAGPGTHHGPIWQRIVNEMSMVTALNITRCYSDSDLPVHAVETKAVGYKYNFRCKRCGCELHYHKETKFVKTYDQILSYNGQPRWTCTKCGGSFEKI